MIVQNMSDKGNYILIYKNNIIINIIYYFVLHILIYINTYYLYYNLYLYNLY